MTAPTTSNKAICRTCGVSGPPWHHQPSVLDPEGIGDPGHKVAPQNTSNISNELEEAIRAIIGDEDWKYTEQPYRITKLIQQEKSALLKDLLEQKVIVTESAQVDADGTIGVSVNAVVSVSILEQRLKDLNQEGEDHDHNSPFNAQVDEDGTVNLEYKGPKDE